MWGADRKIRPRVTVWHHEALPSDAKQDPEEQIFLSVANNHDRFFFLHTFSSPTVAFNAEVAINEWRSYTLMSAILKTDVVCDVAMMSIPNILTTELHDLLYDQCIDNICCFSFFIYPMWWIRVCKIKLISTGENRGKPCLVCKKSWVSEDN